MDTKKAKGVSVSESIIFAQALLILSVGIAGWLSSSTVIAGFNALNNKESAVYFITEEKIVTDVEVISTSRAEAIIRNFQLVCVTSLTIGAAVLLASLVRLAKRSRTKESSTSSTNASKYSKSTSNGSSKHRTNRMLDK